MSIAVVCAVPDGVVIGADSAITSAVPDGRVLKVFEDAEKVFPLCRQPGTSLNECFVGVATYGMGTLGARTVESYVREFCGSDAGAAVLDQTVERISRAVGDWLGGVFEREVQPIVEQVFGKPLAEIPDGQRPVLGLTIAGFSPKVHLPEVWNIQVPDAGAGGGVAPFRSPGEFGVSWWGVTGPITRFVKGFDPAVLDRVAAYLQQRFEFEIDKVDPDEIRRILTEGEWSIPYQTMPVQEAVNLTRFLLGLAISYTHFAAGAPVCGGPIRVALITRADGFRWVQRPEVEVRQL